MSFESSFNWVSPRVLSFGEKPGRWRSVEEDLAFLKRENVRTILSLVEEEPHMETYGRSGFRAHHVPVDDFNAPTMEQISHCLEVIRVDAPIYIHCYAGYGRSGTIAAAWLIQNGMAATDAVRIVRRLRPGAIEVDVQFDALIQFAARYRR